MIPLLGKRLPFELAEPGTDPTRKAPPRPRQSLLRENQWLLIGLLVFLGVGYWKFVRKPAPRRAVAADPAPTVIASPTPAPGGFFDGDGGGHGLFSNYATISHRDGNATCHRYVPPHTYARGRGYRAWRVR